LLPRKRLGTMLTQKGTVSTSDSMHAEACKIMVYCQHRGLQAPGFMCADASGVNKNKKTGG